MLADFSYNSAEQKWKGKQCHNSNYYDFVLSKNVALKSKASHWWRMGDDNNDRVSKESSVSSQSNRIYDQIGVSHLTPQRFRSASSGIHDVKKYPDGFVDDLVEMINSVPGFSLEKFCQLLLLQIILFFHL